MVNESKDDPRLFSVLVRANLQRGVQSMSVVVLLKRLVFQEYTVPQPQRPRLLV